ncbi:MAG TPA: hemolysin III family protein [Candidatus Dormibacteraeota bacterium]|jgi:hemolysin III|nr:hemolysin III family protein [Candidatus Dormibacteraeota bacterium]
MKPAEPAVAVAAEPAGPRIPFALDLRKPLLRGYLHAGAAPLALVGVAALIYLSESWAARITLAIYGLTLVGLYAFSAVYHIGNWTPRVSEALRRVDHSNIYLVIAGTYTPIAALALRGWWRVSVLSLVWGMALAGVLLALPGWQVRRQVQAVLYVGMGWVALVATPQIVGAFGVGGMVMLGAGGLLYSLGAVVYALRWPPLWQRVFGYHELFHILTIVASACFFVFMALFLLHHAPG